MASTVRVSRLRPLVLAAVVALLTCLATLVPAPGPAAAAAVPPAFVAPAPATPANAAASGAQGTTSVDALALSGTRTTVTVRRIYRRGQVQWVDHVLDTRLVNVDGCQARRATSPLRANVYRASVYAVCPDDAGAQRAAARALVRSRPWYRVTVQQVPLVGFTLLAEGAAGSDRAVPAALAKLPDGPATFFEGDDVSFTYAGPGVTQARLDAAVQAFAAALDVPVSEVTVSSLTS